MNETPVEHGFFRWVRELEVRRGTDHWIGGVASGLAERLGLAPILVRGIFVALSCLAGLGLLVYGLAWALLPGPDGSIHAQQAMAGRWSNGMTGALVFFVGGAIGFPWFFSWWDGGFWTFAVIAAILFIVFSRSGRFGDRPMAANQAGTPETGPWAAQYPSSPEGQRPEAPGTPGAPSAFGAVPARTSPGDTAHGGQSPTTMGPEAGQGSTPDPDSDPDSDLTIPFDVHGPHGPAAGSATGSAATAAADNDTYGDATTPLDRTPRTSTETTPAASPDTAEAGFGPADQERTMPFAAAASPREPRIDEPLPPLDPAWPGTPDTGSGFTPPPYVPPVYTPQAPAPKPPRLRAMPGYAASIVLGLAVLVFALVVGLNELGWLDLPASPVAVGFAAALVVIALGLVGAALNQRTGGALVGFGIATLVCSLIWSGGALRMAEFNMFSSGISTTDEGGSTNVFHSGEMDLRHYSTITEDTEVSIDNVFSSLKLVVPDNIPVVLEFSGAFTSLNVNGADTATTGGSTRLNPAATGPTLRIDLDGAFNSVEVSVQKAEVAP
ncbi:PspC domain-containing protein [Paeniglutamicibacter sp. R2-26]|uniref:PspC domain-containing protein n=1 Tax=Paeniglutamicibacter sp. R2-26 TaxID=3144417 RepID=UPI003EE4D3D1